MKSTIPVFFVLLLMTALLFIIAVAAKATTAYDDKDDLDFVLSSSSSSSNLKPEYVTMNLDSNPPPPLLMSSSSSLSQERLNTNNNGNVNDESYVFLQKFPLLNTDGLLFHTEVLICPRNEFSSNDQVMLDDTATSLNLDFVEMNVSWWINETETICVELGYGGAACTERCCAVPFGDDQITFPLATRRAVISNADTSQKSLYYYGRTLLNGQQVYDKTCCGKSKCWSNWAGTDYNALTNNCNTFTSAVLACVCGVSEKKPNLGPSDIITVTCDKCPTSSVSSSSISTSSSSSSEAALQ